VSLLIASLAFEGDDATTELAKTAILVASVLAALIASGFLSRRNAQYKKLRALNKGLIPDDVLNDPRKP